MTFAYFLQLLLAEIMAFLKEDGDGQDKIKEFDTIIVQYWEGLARQIARAIEQIKEEVPEMLDIWLAEFRKRIIGKEIRFVPLKNLKDIVPSRMYQKSAQNSCTRAVVQDGNLVVLVACAKGFWVNVGDTGDNFREVISSLLI